MYVLNVRNVHEALPDAIWHLLECGIRRDSRNGPVWQSAIPVATVYQRPRERVLFWPERDANPFFHLYESLWMLAGRNDVDGPTKYVKSFAQYSDDGKTFHGAYGHRWRHHFYARHPVTNHWEPPIDQLDVIIRRLKADPTDRRCVLGMHDPATDLDAPTKDQPCNLTVTFQVSAGGYLDMVVFNRSNDIVWGCYGANAVHFSMLQEYMATRIGVPMGTYTQISVNWHGYVDTVQKVAALRHRSAYDEHYQHWTNPYNELIDGVVAIPMPEDQLDARIAAILIAADTGTWIISRTFHEDPWTRIVCAVLSAHQMYREGNIDAAFSILGGAPFQNADWIVAARQWLERREAKRRA